MYLRRCLEIEPSNVVAAITLGGALYHLGQIAEAEVVLQEVVSRNPPYADAYDFLGLIRSRQGRFIEAVALHRKAVDFAPEKSTWRFHLGMALYRSNKPKEAMTELREAIRSGPEDKNVLKTAAWIAATSEDAEVRSGTDAVRWAERAAKLSKDEDPAILDGLAAAYAESGRFPEAMTTAQKALDLANSKNDISAEVRIRAASRRVPRRKAASGTAVGSRCCTRARMSKRASSIKQTPCSRDAESSERSAHRTRSAPKTPRRGYTGLLTMW